MKVCKDFCYVTQSKNGKLFMWADEPHKVGDEWVGKYPYVNSVVYGKLHDIIGDRKLDEPEMITWT